MVVRLLSPEFCSATGRLCKEAALTAFSLRDGRHDAASRAATLCVRRGRDRDRPDLSRPDGQAGAPRRCTMASKSSADAALLFQKQKKKNFFSSSAAAEPEEDDNDVITTSS